LYYSLAGLNCANCAAKIERELRKVKGLETITVDVISQRLDLPPELVPQAQEVIARVERGVTLVASTNSGSSMEEGTREAKAGLDFIIVAAIFLAVGFIFNTPLHHTPYSWAEYLVLLSAYLLVGWPVLQTAFRNLKHGEVFDENFLMALATMGAIAIHQLLEAVAVMLFYAVGNYFQSRAVKRSRRSIAALLDIRPEFANLLIDGQTKEVRPEEVEVGQTIVVKPGERVSLDGEVADGVSFIDTAALTGESVPRRIKKGEQILAGMINGQGILTVKVTRPFSASSVARILDLVEKAAARKAPTEQFITSFCRYYTPLVVTGAVALALIPPLILPGATFSQWVYRALVMLVISCPCALVVSIPLSYFGGIGRASRRGILEHFHLVAKFSRTTQDPLAPA
jgi:Cd2+/Zn2+-exporting ATPase